MRTVAIVPLLALLAIPAWAQPVKCVDPSGKVRYVDKSAAGTMKCEPVKGEAQVGSSGGLKPPAAPKAAAKGEPPPRTEEERRAQIAAAEKRLAEARKHLAEQENIREGGERNYSRVQERLAPYQRAVEAAEYALDEARRR
jgi:hypothetical protein